MSFKRRQKVSSGYIGSGNNSSTFNQSSRVPFEKIRSKYESDLLHLEINSKDSKTRTKKEKLRLKERIAKRISKEKQIVFLRVVLTIVITCIIFYFFIKYKDNWYFIGKYK